MKTYKLSKDNKFDCTDNGSKRTVEISEDSFIYHLKQFFKWKTPTKHYKTMIDRYYGLGSIEHDDFINYLIKRGY